MRHFTTYAIIGTLVALLVICTGCLSKQAREQIAEQVFTQVLAPPTELVASVTGFRLAKKRWPQDREELSNFIEHPNGQFHPIRYDRVDFTKKPDGSLQIYATTQSMTNTMTINVTEAGPK